MGVVDALVARLVDVLDLYLNKGRQQIAIREVIELLRTIKSDVASDVTRALNTALVTKTDTSVFESTSRELQEAIADLQWMKPEVDEWSNLKKQLAGVEKSAVDRIASTLDESIAR